MTDTVGKPKERVATNRRGPFFGPPPPLPSRPVQPATFKDEQERAHENRLRVAFLSTKGHTMPMWLAERAAILAASTDEIAVHPP